MLSLNREFFVNNRPILEEKIGAMAAITLESLYFQPNNQFRFSPGYWAGVDKYCQELVALGLCSPNALLYPGYEINTDQVLALAEE